ncbi:MAG: DNA-directed RNA polymerase subunit P [Candidatus Woesearchaeota archaeon]|nr:DNA-directed RNA polymerase subunit P [Candidatus Woesearchaeota archaeon]
MYKCFSCNKELKEEQIKKRVRCMYCGSRIVFKSRTATVKIRAQ